MQTGNEVERSSKIQARFQMGSPLLGSECGQILYYCRSELTQTSDSSHSRRPSNALRPGSLGSRSASFANSFDTRKKRRYGPFLASLGAAGILLWIILSRTKAKPADWTAALHLRNAGSDVSASCETCMATPNDALCIKYSADEIALSRELF